MNTIVLNMLNIEMKFYSRSCFIYIIGWQFKTFDIDRFKLDGKKDSMAFIYTFQVLVL